MRGLPFLILGSSATTFFLACGFSSSDDSDSDSDEEATDSSSEELSPGLAKKRDIVFDLRKRRGSATQQRAEIAPAEIFSVCNKSHQHQQNLYTAREPRPCAMILDAARAKVSGMQTLCKRNTFCGHLHICTDPLSGTPAPHLRALRPQNGATGMRQQNVLFLIARVSWMSWAFYCKKKEGFFLFCFSPRKHSLRVSSSASAG